jgi:hypothetical protein
VGTKDDPESDSRRSRRGADPLALRIFELLRPLPEEDRRSVLSSLDAGDSKGARPERTILARAAVDRFLSETGGPPSKRRYERWRVAHDDRGEIPSATFIETTYGSWSSAMDAMGLKPSIDHLGYRLRALGPSPSDEDVVADLRRCGEELDTDRLLFREYRAWAKEQEREGRGPQTLLLSPNSFIKRFGSFTAALRLAGLEPALNGPRSRTTENTPERLAECLRQAAEDTGRLKITIPGYEAWRQRRYLSGEDVPSAWTITKHLGSWSTALGAAGLTAPNEAELGYGRGRGRKVSIDHMARCLIAVARSEGQLPTVRSYERWRGAHADRPDLPRVPSAATVISRIARWTRVRALLEEALRRPEPQKWLTRALGREEERRAR